MPGDVYVVREQMAGWNYSGEQSPSTRKVIKGIGPVFRNKMRLHEYVVLQTFQRGGDRYREIMFIDDGSMKHVADEMFFGTSKEINWDPKDDIMKHPELARLRNKEVLNLHLKEVIDALTMGIGEVPKVTISSNSYVSAGNDTAELSYDHVNITVQLKNALRGR